MSSLSRKGNWAPHRGIIPPDPREDKPLNRKRECLQSYFAGLFDGEGCVGLYFNATSSWHLNVQLHMTEPAAVGLLYREYPEGSFRKKHYSGDRKQHKPYYHWVVTGSKAERFLKEIKPYSIVKHGQIKLALSFLAARGRESIALRKSGRSMRNGYSESFHKRAQSIASKLKEAKIPDANGVNSVNLLLEHELREYRAKPEHVRADVLFIAQALEGVETRLK